LPSLIKSHIIYKLGTRATFLHKAPSVPAVSGAGLNFCT